VKPEHQQLLDRIDARILIETAFTDPDPTTQLLVEARQNIIDLIEAKQDLDLWSNVIERIFIGRPT